MIHNFSALLLKDPRKGAAQKAAYVEVLQYGPAKVGFL